MVDVCICIDHKLSDHWSHVYNSILKYTDEFNFHIVCDKSIDVIGGYTGKLPDNITLYMGVDIPFFEMCRLKCKNTMRSKTMFYRYYAPHLINTDRLIYTDCDVVFQTDINELAKIDLGENIIAAPPDPVNCRKEILVEWQCNQDYKLDMGNETTLFASGFLVFDCKKWKEQGIFQRMAKLYQFYPMMDMPLYNHCCYGKILQLQNEWCVPANYITGSQGKYRNEWTGYEYKKVKCFHWNGEKPWSAPDKCRYVSIFNEYAKEIK